MAPPLRRRLAALLYEGLLVFGLLMAGGFAHYAITRSSFDPQHSNASGWVALAVLTAYFGACWTRGQTLAMKTWFISVIDRQHGGPPGWPRALLRFALAWLLVLPALGLLYALGLGQERKLIYLGVTLNVLVYAGLSWLLPGRQFLHDWLAGTALIDQRNNAA
ncbi:RDD family protein [Inhella inkyongensis]|nr:RDD family protein [Inhella inkyongensis]